MSLPHDEKRLFVYGSLMHGRHNHQKNLEGAVISRVRARIRGSVYHMTEKGYPALVSGGDWVHGELLALRDFVQRVDLLDEFEEYFGPEDPRNEYERMAVQVYPEDGEPEEAYAYLYALFDLDSPSNPAVLVPQGDWGAFMDRKQGG